MQSIREGLTNRYIYPSIEIEITDARFIALSIYGLTDVSIYPLYQYRS